MTTALVVAVLIYLVRDIGQLAAWRTALDVALHSAMATAGVHFALRAIGFVPHLSRLAWRGLTSAWRWITNMMRAASAWCARHVTFRFEFKLDFGGLEPRSA